MAVEQLNTMFAGGGSSAQILLNNGLNLDALRPCVEFQANATLRKDEWEELDRVAVNAFNERLVAVADLRERGLTQPLGGLGTLISQYNQISQMNAAHRSMWASTDAEQSRVLMNLVNVPIPAIFSEFQIDIRVLESSRRLGDALDTIQAEEAGRVVAEDLEDLLFNGDTAVMGGTPIYGYRTHPNRNTSAGASWGTGSNIYPNILTMVSGLSNDRVPGPYILYLHSDQFIETLEVNTNTDMTYHQTALSNIPQLLDIKIADKMTAGEAVMVAMNRRTVDLAVAEDFTNVEWDSKGGLSVHFRGLMAGAPRVKDDFDGRCGVYHMTGI